MFLIGKKNKLLNALGITYGTIHIEGCNAFSTIDIETAETALKHAVEKKLVDPEQTATILVQIHAAGVAPTPKEVFEVAAQAVIPEGFEPSFSFVLHKDCGLPLPHGNIGDPEKGQTKPLTTLVEGLNLLAKWVNDCDVPLPVTDGVYLIKEMIAAKLPINDVDYNDQYLALPQEVRDEFEKSLSTIDFEPLWMSDFGDVMTVEIGLPVRP